MDSRLQVSRLDNTDTEDEIEIELRDILYILKRKFRGCKNSCVYGK